MMNVPLTVTSIMRHAERFAGKTEIVSVSNDNPRYKYTYAEAFRRARCLANAFLSSFFSTGFFSTVV